MRSSRLLPSPSGLHWRLLVDQLRSHSAHGQHAAELAERLAGVALVGLAVLLAVERLA